MTVDQSIRIEETGKDTVIAFVDKKYSHSLRIKSNIGKQDKAHILAINTHRKEIKADFDLTGLEIIKFVNYVVSHKK